MKPCQKCHENKPLDAYHRLAKSPDGRQPRCKSCVAAYMREYHQRNAEAINTKVQAWREQNPERRKALDAEANRRWNARAKVARLAAKAQMVRPCAECGDPLAPEKFLSARFCSTVCQERAGRRRWKRENPEKHREATRRYRTNNPDALRRKDQRRRARKHAAFVEDIDPPVVFERDAGLCGICGHPADPEDFHIDHIIPLARGGEHSYRNVQVAHPLCNLRKRDQLPEEMVA